MRVAPLFQALMRRPPLGQSLEREFRQPFGRLKRRRGRSLAHRPSVGTGGVTRISHRVSNARDETGNARNVAQVQ